MAVWTRNLHTSVLRTKGHRTCPRHRILHGLCSLRCQGRFEGSTHFEPDIKRRWHGFAPNDFSSCNRRFLSLVFNSCCPQVSRREPGQLLALGFVRPYRSQRFPPFKSSVLLHPPSLESSQAVYMWQQPISPARRFNSRVETPEGVWVDWRAVGCEDVSRVLNISFGGLFVETRTSRGLGSVVQLEFLVQEGQIRAEAIVRRVELGHGLALKFTSVSEQDSPRLAMLIERMRQSS
jgi:hypothetical protein